MKACQLQNYFTVLYLEKSLIHKINRMRGLINITNLTLEMVLAEKPLAWLPVMYGRLIHLIINVEAFREEVRMGHYPQMGGREEK